MTHLPLWIPFRAGFLTKLWSGVVLSVMDELAGVVLERSGVPQPCAATVGTGGQRYIQISDFSNFLPAEVPEPSASGLTVPLVRSTGWRWRH